MPASQPPPEPEMQSPDTGTAEQYAGAFFPRSERLLISGGVFTSSVTNITQGAPPLPPDSRMVPMGDIYLRHGVAVVTRRRKRKKTICRMYSARIEGRQTDMTVAMFQGDNAEQEWREDLSRYLWLRHPNFLQVYGAARSHGIHAIILHDELILADDFVDLLDTSDTSHFVVVHLCARLTAEVKDANDYFDSVFHKDLEDLDGTSWIDRSNGRLVIDIMSNRSRDDAPPSSQDPCPMAAGIDTVMLLNEYHRLFPPLTSEQYHSITYDDASNTSSHYVEGPAPAIHLASILWNSEGLKTLRRKDVANPVIIPANPVITKRQATFTMFSKTMANGWECYESNNVAEESIYREVIFERPESWLSQANHIFDQLNVTSKKENYALVDALEFTVIVGGHARGDVRGYLFVCPPEDFKQPGTSSFRWPNCPAYWSFDPTGAERLGTEAAMCLGFPVLRFRTRVKLESWDDSVYTGLREFHESRGFDPDSRDVARDLGYIIYKVSDGESSTADDEDSFDSPIQDLQVHNLSSVHLATPCSPEDFVPLSRASIFLMTAKLALILFIAVSSAYNKVRAQWNVPN